MKTKMMIAFSLLGIITLTSVAQTDSIDYFGQTPPGDTAVIFATATISLPNRQESKMAFSPNGKELYFNTPGGIYYTQRVNDIWMEQVEAPFSVNRNAGSPFFSADGNRLYFDCWNTEGTSSDIYMAERTAGGWGEPQLLPSPINSASVEGSYTETADGSVYITSRRPGGFDQYGDIWCIHRLPDQSLQAENLGSIVNSTSYDCDPFVAPDGSYLIFSSDRPGGYGNQDLYICFNNGNSGWNSPVNLERNGAGINIPGHSQISPSLSPDGKFLFFSRHIEAGEPFDVYWVSTHILVELNNTGIGRLEEQKIEIFPNPTNGLFTISFSHSKPQEGIIEVYNTEGKRLLSKSFHNTTTSTIDLTGNPKGIYLVKLMNEVVWNKKICLE